MLLIECQTAEYTICVLPVCCGTNQVYTIPVMRSFILVYSMNAVEKVDEKSSEDHCSFFARTVLFRMYENLREWVWDL